MVSRLVRVTSMDHCRLPMLSNVEMTYRFSRSPLELATWRRSTTAAVQMISTSLRRGMGCTPNRTMGLRPVPQGSTKYACRAEVRATVSTLALIAGNLSSGSATHSSQPRMKGDCGDCIAWHPAHRFASCLPDRLAESKRRAELRPPSAGADVLRQ